MWFQDRPVLGIIRSSKSHDLVTTIIDFRVEPEISNKTKGTKVMSEDDCLFCRIVSRKTDAVIVYEDEETVAFLDHRPLFPGHCLLIPRQHYETLPDLPSTAVGKFFKIVQLLSAVVPVALNAQGSFVAMNNRVSQSVAHLHVHVVPRTKGDGLKGFFWPRMKYKTTEEMIEVGKILVDAIGKAEK